MRTFRKVATASLGYGALLLLVGLFLVDLSTPKGLALGGLYSIVALVSIWSPQPYMPVGVAAAASLLVLLTNWQSPGGGDAGLASHLLTVLAIWVAAFVAIQTRQVLQAREESESRWKAIAENPFQYVAILDRDGVYRYLNRAPRGARVEEFLGRETFFNRITPEGVPAAQDALRQLFENGRPAYIEMKARHADEWYGCNFGPIEQGGKIVGASVLARDITAEKNAVDALRASEQQSRERLEVLEGIYRSAPVGHCVLDRELRYVRINEWLAAIHGIPVADHIGRHIREVIPGFADFVEGTCRKVLETQQPRLNVEIEGFAPGTQDRRHWLASYFPWRAGGGSVRGVHVVVLDVTRSKSAARALEQSEARFCAVFDNAAAGIALINPDGRFERVNPALCHAFGYSEKELVGRLVDDVTHADDVHFSRQALALVRDGQSNVARFQKRYLSRNGEVIWTKVMVAALCESDKPPRQLVAVIADITEQIQAQQALRESEAVRRSITESSPDYIAMLDRDGRYLFANRVAAGYKPESIMGAPIFEIISEENADIVRRSLQRTAETRRPERFEVEHVLPGGSRMWFDSLVGPVIKDGEVAAFIVNSRDVTDRKRAARALKESEDRYRKLTELSPNAILLTRNDRIVYVNDAGLDLFGASSGAQIHGKSIYELLDPGSRALIRQGFAGLDRREGKPPHIEAKIVCIDGSVQDVEVVAGTIVEDGEAAIQVVLRGIGERKKAEEALARSEQHFRSLIENSLDVFSILNRDGTSRYQSPSLTRVLGYRPDELNGKNPFELVHPDDAVIARSQFCEGLRAPGTHQPIELRMRHRDGSWRAIEVIANNQLDNPAVRGIVVTARDVTDRQRALEDRQQLEAQLWQAQKLEALGVLAGGIAHDFNNLLTSVAGFTTLAAEDAPKGSRAREHLEEALGACDHARDLVKQMLTFGRREQRQKQPVDIAQSIREAVRLTRATIPGSIEIRYNISPDCGMVLADAGQLQQVLMNLSTNAYQAMAPNPGTLDVEVLPVQVTPALAATLPGLHAGRYVKLTIGDSGPGIDPKIRSRIFEPFVTTKGVGEGSGLGLSVVHGIVAGHGGGIAVESAPGQGACFSIYLPRHDTGVPTRALSSQPVPHRAEHVLFVDDEDSVVRLGRQILERLGYRVTALRRGAESLDVFKERPAGFDVVISDISMPVMNGVELAAEIKKLRSDIPVILITGFHSHVHAENAKRLGVREVLFKPFTADQLNKAIHGALVEAGIRNGADSKHLKGASSLGARDPRA